MDKQIYLIAGLPRSSSTLLCNILNQNPRFHATTTSGVIDLIRSVRDSWNDVKALRASPNSAAKEAVLKGILPNYYSGVERPVIFDKSRKWLANLELAERLLDHELRVLVTVRDIPEILASLETLWRQHGHAGTFRLEHEFNTAWQTREGRFDTWMRGNQSVGYALNNIRDAVNRGFYDRMHFVEHRDLCVDPSTTMDSIYHFLGEDKYEHNFENVEQVTHENDDVWGMPDLHTIQPKVELIEVDPNPILGPETVQKYSGLEFWRTIVD